MTPPGFADFWEQDPRIDWSEGSACEVVYHFYVINPPSSAPSINEPGRTVYRVQLLLADILALLPAEPPTPEPADGFHPTVKWITDEAKKMRAAGEAPDSIRITQFSKELAARMSGAAKKPGARVKPVGWRHIKNELRGWGLWPVTSIKE